MSDETPMMGFSRRELVPLTVVVAVVLAVLDRGWLRWAAVASLIGATGLYLHRTSRAWLKTFGQEASPPVDRTAHDFDEWLRPFAALGFSRPLWWVIDDEAGITMLSSDGSVTARTAKVDAGRGPIFSTEWPDALLRTSRGLGVSIRSNDYLQILPRLEIRELYAAHQEAVEILSGRYGQPVTRDEWTVEALNERSRRRHDWLRRHRYLRTAKTVARWYGNFGYRGRIAQQVSLTTNLWLVWLFLLGTWGLVAWVWISAISTQSTARIGIAVFVTLISTMFSVAALVSLRKRRLFSRHASADAEQ